MPRPFFVLATQNPVELEGTFPLPEAQLDRFLLRTTIGYPALDDERNMLRRFRHGNAADQGRSRDEPEEMLELIADVRQVHIGVAVEDYLLDLVRRTRTHEGIEVGASPRASLALARASQARAALAGRDYVIPDDVRDMAAAVLAHRVMPTSQADLLGHSNEALIATVIAETPVPVESLKAV